ncbi:DUF3951 domain-containing protein [Bacillus sp. 165]|uniref:DUF3951 domain-containing protein n=1 Tax=Bacillus sp. 165 TaxID=1529117 RepID=UPI001ADB8E11|nr:DUF3951 domain-containing protein [Bacillus sp. 165]MBO9129356.1 DUF3951 domain-containing protein [Bacillus sp. 165]
MHALDLAAIGLPLAIVVLTLIGFYKVFIQKRRITAYYTPFDHITGHSLSPFHEEQEVIAVDEDQGNGKK